MQIIITSTNPVKKNAVELGFSQMFPQVPFQLHTFSAESGVSAQPMSEEETLRGALQRVENSLSTYPDADFHVGIEGGIEFTANGEVEAFAWVVIRAKDGGVGKGRSGSFILPHAIVELIREGKELGEADDIIFKQTNSKQKGGTVGTLTHHVIDRTEYYRHAVIFALIPFANLSLYKK